MSITRNMIIGPKQHEGPFQADGNDAFMRYTLGYKDFNAATTTTNFDLPNFPAGALIEDVFFVCRANFTGGGNASATISIGSTATPTLYVLAKSVFATTPPQILGIVAADKGTAFSSPQSNFVNQGNPFAQGTVRVQLITSVNANLLTSGVVDVFIEIRGVSIRA